MPVSTYERSKAIESIAWQQIPLGRGMALALLEESTAPRREAKGQALLDVLNAAAGLPPCRLAVVPRPQMHRTRGGRLEQKTYGYYRCDWNGGTVRRGAIRIYNLTAIRQQVLSPKVFLETLLHEWVHHYDFAGLRLDRSPHTSGFYARVRALAEILGVAFVVPPKREPLSPAADDVVGPAPGRSAGSDPPQWLRERIASLLGLRRG